MRVRLTHLLSSTGVDSSTETDALALTEGPSPVRVFVPGWLPCGECGRCRRGWAATCLRGIAPFARATEPSLDLPERFLTLVDEPPGVAPLSDERAVCAGNLAAVLEATARAGTGPGDVAIWIGRDSRSILGIRATLLRGCRTFAFHPSGGVAGAQLLDPAAPAEAWRDAVNAASQGGPANLQERRIFVADADGASVAAAAALAEPGSTIVFLRAQGAATLRPALLPCCRILVGAERHYHPDFVVDALAALRSEGMTVEDLIVPKEGDASVSVDRLVLQRLS